jgi:hypothetical protein
VIPVRDPWRTHWTAKQCCGAVHCSARWLDAAMPKKFGEFYSPADIELLRKKFAAEQKTIDAEAQRRLKRE